MLIDWIVHEVDKDGGRKLYLNTLNKRLEEVAGSCDMSAIEQMNKVYCVYLSAVRKDQD